MPIILKGVQCWEDAIEAYDRGCAGVVLSNHGGRQLEFSRSGIEVLAEVVDHFKKKRKMSVVAGSEGDLPVGPAVASGSGSHTLSSTRIVLATTPPPADASRRSVAATVALNSPCARSTRLRSSTPQVCLLFSNSVMILIGSTGIATGRQRESSRLRRRFGTRRDGEVG